MSVENDRKESRAYVVKDPATWEHYFRCQCREAEVPEPDPATMKVIVSRMMWLLGEAHTSGERFVQCHMIDSLNLRHYLR